MWLLPIVQESRLTEESTGGASGFQSNIAPASQQQEETPSPTLFEIINTLLTLEESALARFSESTTLLRLIYELITMLTEGSGVSISRNGTDNLEITKTSSNNSWGGGFHTSQGFSAPVTMEFKKRASASDNGASYLMVGWNVNPTGNSSYDSIDHAAYPYQQNQYVVYDNGNNSNHGAWDENKTFYLTFTRNGRIEHWNGNTLLYSSNYNPATVYVDGSIYSANATWATLRDFRIMKAQWNGTTYV